MNEQNNENGNIEQDVFAEVLKTACAALYGDTATRRLAAGDIIHALASAYPGAGQAKNPAQVFEVRVDRGCGGYNVFVCENGKGLFTMTFGGAHWIREYVAVKALKALLAARRKDHARNRRRRKNRAARAAAEKAGFPF